MSTRELFVATACNCLRTGRKSLSVPQCLELAAQVSAVDVGLKPAFLYDSNGASAAQVHRYLSTLQSLQLVSKSLVTLDLSGNSLIINVGAVRSNLKRVLHDTSVAVINVCHFLEKPIITDSQSGILKSMTQELLLCLEGFLQLEEAEEPLCVWEKCEEWNLCTAFGLLLGYPVTYWFDQNKSFENCLSMTPLTVFMASATWQVDGGGHTCCLYSFSVPAALQQETETKLEGWQLRLRERFEQQHVLKDLSIHQSSVTLPSVCL